MTLQPATNRQLPDHAILDFYNKQTYLANQYLFTASPALTNTSEASQYLLVNAALTTAAFPNKPSLFVNLKKLVCLTASNTALFKFYLNPTISSTGTASVPVNLRPASPNVSVAGMYTAAQFSVSANGTYIGALFSAAQEPDLSQLMQILDPGQSMLITSQVSASSTVAFDLAWYEI